ncbi:unnamed protein product [Camellia sinensis]
MFHYFHRVNGIRTPYICQLSFNHLTHLPGLEHYRNRGIIEGAQMSDILIWPDIIYQSWIDGSLGVYMSSSSCESSYRAAIPPTCGQGMEVPDMTVSMFTHPKYSITRSNQWYMKLQFEMPNDTGSALAHGASLDLRNIYLNGNKLALSRYLVQW